MEQCATLHEQDHINYFKTKKGPNGNTPYCSLCAGKPDGYKSFQTTPDDFQEMECSGYRLQYQCMRNKLPQMTNQHDWLAAMNKLKSKATKEHGCETTDW